MGWGGYCALGPSCDCACMCGSVLGLGYKLSAGVSVCLSVRLYVDHLIVCSCALADYDVMCLCRPRDFHTI